MKDEEHPGGFGAVADGLYYYRLNQSLCVLVPPSTCWVIDTCSSSTGTVFLVGYPVGTTTTAKSTTMAGDFDLGFFQSPKFCT